MDQLRADAGQTLCISPSTGETIGHSYLNSEEEVRQAIAAGHAVQPEWAALPVKARAARIRPLINYFFEHGDELAEQISRDNGKTRTDAMIAEVVPAALSVGYYCRKAKRLLAPRRLMPGTPLLANKLSRMYSVPYGVIGIISPWNYPLSIPFAEVIMALLAGNAVLLKVASETQVVGRAIERCINSLDLPEGLFTHVNVPGRQAGPLFLEAGVDKLFFTGSVGVGKQLMAEAAKTLTPVVLELGGNDPMLVCPDADIPRAVLGAMWGGLQNSGQSCGGVERIYVHRTVYQPFMDELTRRVSRLRVGIDTNYDVDLGAITTTRQMEEVLRQVSAATEAGAVIAARSQVPDKGAGGNFMPAIVLTRVDHSMDVMRLETFGPVLGVMPVDDMDQAVELANDSDLGLTASVWTKNRGEGIRLARRIKAGVVMINDHLMSHGMAETPWGGFKNSGIGRTHGPLGMAEMVQPQCIVNDVLPFARRNMFWHPHGPAVYRGMRGILGYIGGTTIKDRIMGLLRVAMLFSRTFFIGK